MLLRLLLAISIVYLPNALHFSGETLVVGLNFSNLLFLGLLLAVPLLAPEGAPRLAGPGRLTPALLGLFLAYIVAFLIAQMRSPADLMDDLSNLKAAIFYPLFYFVYRNCRLDLRATRQLIILMLVVAAVAGMEAVKESISANMMDDYSPGRRASGPFGVNANAANLAGFFYAMFLPMFVAMALFFRRQRLWRLAAVAGCIILGLAIMATFSRQAYVIALLCLLLVALRRSIIVASLIGVLMVASVSVLPESVTQRVEETKQASADGSEALDASAASRLDIWAGALQMWREHPVGVGLNRFHTRIGQYSQYEGFDAHNYYILMLAEAGALGVAALLWVLWRLWGLARALLRSTAAMDAEAQALATGFSLLVIAMAMGNIFGSFFQLGSAMAVFWMLCGLMERYGALRVAAMAATDRNGMADVGSTPSVTPGARFPLAARAVKHRSLQELGDA